MIRKAFSLFLLVIVMGNYFCYPVFPKERKPLTPDMVRELLREGVTSNRITHIIEEHGINFGKLESFSNFLKELRNNGANKNLINAVKREWERISGILVVKAEPHSDVYIDGKHKGLTPVRITLKTGQHHIRIRNSDLKGEWRQTVNIKRDQTQTIYHKFETGSLTVNAEPWGIIYIDGERVGETPETLKLAAGNHKIRIVRKGYSDFIRDIVIQPRGRKNISPNF